MFPKKGDVTIWYNLLRSNHIDMFSMHKACAVVLGQKWIGNKWISLDGQWNEANNKCGLNEFDWYSF